MKYLNIFIQIFFNIIYFFQIFKCLNVLKTLNKKNNKLFYICFLFSIISYIFYLLILYNNIYDKVAFSIILLANAFVFSSNSISVKKNRVI